MFDNGTQRKEEEVKLILTDGRTIAGTLLLPMTSEIRRALSGDSAVLEFKHADGQLTLIAKAHVVEIILVKENEAARAQVAA